MNRDYTDDEIMAMYRSGERDNAFRALMHSYGERLYWHIRRFTLNHEDTDDILQETFVKVWAALPTFREDSKLITWVYKIATNEALNFLRRQKTRKVLDTVPIDTALERKIDDDPYFNGDELQRELRKAILHLPKMQRTVFNMRYFDDMSYKDISLILNTSVGSLKASYHHAYKKIKASLEKIF